MKLARKAIPILCVVLGEAALIYFWLIPGFRPRQGGGEVLSLGEGLAVLAAAYAFYAIGMFVANALLPEEPKSGSEA